MRKNLNFMIVLTLAVVALFYLSADAGKETAELIFSHKLHIVDNELDCSSCHAGVENSTSGKDNLMPSMENCSSCHDVETTDICSTCHSDTEKPRNVPRVELSYPLFSHQQHLSVGLECGACHEGIEQKEKVEPYLLPVKQSCQNCHIERMVKPKTHTAEYKHNHGDDIKVKSNVIDAAQTCNTCHNKVFCQYCHEGDNLDRTTHPLNYAFTHAQDAVGKENQCTACHIERSFCAECHKDNFIMPHNHVGGWAIPNVGGNHVSEALMDLENCMTCHETNAEQTCQKSGCHSK